PRPRGRGLREGTPDDLQPALQKVTISGPYNAAGAGDTPSRRRIFICRTADLACANQILATLTRRAYRRPSTDAEVKRLLPFYQAGLAEGGFEMGIQRAIERVLVSPQFLFRMEHEPASIAPNMPYRITDLELA